MNGRRTTKRRNNSGEMIFEMKFATYEITDVNDKKDDKRYELQKIKFNTAN